MTEAATETETPANYNYDVKIGYGADLIKSGPLSKSFENCGEILITSKAYHDYHDCERSLSDLMSTLTHIESKLSLKQHVIFTKINPILDENRAQRNDLEAWDRHTVLRAYIAEAEALKKATLTFHVFGQIRVDQLILGLTKPEAPK
jgi:hypothetical protein